MFQLLIRHFSNLSTRELPAPLLHLQQRTFSFVKRPVGLELPI